MKQPKVYLAHSVTNVAGTRSSLIELVTWLRIHGFAVTEPHPGLRQADLAATTLRRVDDADVLIADVSEYSHGVGFEIGYMYSLGKPVILICRIQNQNRVSPFVLSVCPKIIFYETCSQLISGIGEILQPSAMVSESAP